MTTPWASPRDEFPESVHALMSLWGGFASPTGYTDSALEKRLELDMSTPISLDSLSVALLEEVMATVDQAMVSHTVEQNMRAVTFSQSLAVMTTRKLVITSCSSVMVHRVLAPILDLFAQLGVRIEWASFFRKNTTAPWSEDSETSDIMAQEYADLKAAFPTGQSFLTGPVDGDHFFHFVYDGIHRTSALRAAKEEDVQVNMFMYDVERADGKNAEVVKDEQRLTPLCGSCGEYEMLRAFASCSFVSFETNATSAIASPDRLQRLLDELRPARFTLVALQDRDIAAMAIRSNLAKFNDYTLQNRSINYFGEGYAFHQLVFARGSE